MTDKKQKEEVLSKLQKLIEKSMLEDRLREKYGCVKHEIEYAKANY